MVIRRVREKRFYFFLLRRERDRHQETTPTSHLDWHPGKLLPYACQPLNSIKKGKRYVQRKRGTRPKPLKKKKKQSKINKRLRKSIIG